MMLGSERTRWYLKLLSQLLGWIYTFSWSASFYPQPILNWQRKSTVGTSIDFPFLNLVGFSCYTTSTWAFLYSTTVKAQYAVRHPKSPESTARFNDFAFGAHAVILVLICYSQFYVFIWGFEIHPSQTVSRPIRGITVGSIIMILTLFGLMVVHNGISNQDATTWAWIDVIYGLGNIKLLVTFFKYMPQVVMNYRRQSTVGWSIGTILFDIIGGVLSLVQLIIDASLQNDWSGIAGNPMKLGLSAISIGFDVIFIVQHYVLYRRSRQDNEEDKKMVNDRAPLLEPT